MAEAGLFTGERVQLLDGRIIHMSPQGLAHSSTTEVLSTWLHARLAGRARVRVQLPLVVSDGSEPEPDVAVCAPGDPRAAIPTTALLVIEVADSSVALDREKARVYAAAGVGEYWIVNLPERVIEVHTEPGASGYATVAVRKPGEMLCIAAFPDVELAVADVIG